MTEVAPPLVVFERAGRAFALPAASVGEVTSDRVAEPVPLAPPAVLGLVLDRGRLLTVIDLDSVLHIDLPAGAISYLVVLAPPFQHLALRVKSEVLFEKSGERSMHPQMLDIEALVQSLEAALASGVH